MQAAGESALREIERIGKRFSFYDPSSELSRLNRQAAKRDVVVAGDFFELLLVCDQLFQSTYGYFDPTIGPLVKLWRTSAEREKVPSPTAVQKALALTGWNHVTLDVKNYSVHFEQEGIQIDLGGIAKGWAIDEAIQLLKDAGMVHALIHGGTSSIGSMGLQDDSSPWTVGIQDPYVRPEETKWFSKITLSDQALSVSAVNGKSFVDREIEYGHVINPKSGQAKTGPWVSWAAGDSAVVCDAWSTAFLAGFESPSDTNMPSFPDPRLSVASIAHKKDNQWHVDSFKPGSSPVSS